MLHRATLPPTPHAADDPTDRTGYLPGMSQTRPPKRSPIKTPPPRQAGESLRGLMDEFLIDRVYGWISLTAGLFLCTTLFWWAYFTKISIGVAAIVVTAMFLGSIPLAYFRLQAARKDYKPLKQGLEGERTVGALLEDLRRSGYRILHDIPNARKPTFNIDHVAIGPGGVFAIETKTYSKVGTPSENIRVVDGRLIIPGIDPAAYGSDPLAQAAASAGFIRDHLTQTTHHKVFVRPVLVFPGWYVEEPPANARDASGVWVLNEKRLFEWIGKSPHRLAAEDIALYTQRLRLHADDCAGS